ncbi:MAG: aldehyde dehydrogenase family protein [Candidatus Nanopelagicales bacterium]|mgnify:CR=1 FL=1|jgi:acyl-CoA reductase-like NAD-dependent aldehyde dehydrogenase|nr:aldehyde dehydrogenase family protein [Actinomycetota bacterium]MBT5500672.1 aldehyde dehydrogenase family protein [Actinomycetota bacterium]MBT5807228.1 aldehyde dehydrogenase family protein [Actinomycetota bacterium]MDA9017130.1 aldehyde dehydrogenase family protein [Actinomycetota bacterium]MDA9870086.1 aldehyde dehydrogenase family protein [bacterium]
MIGNDRVEVRKTHKLFVGGAFPRSESGRTYEATNSQGEFLANVAKASRKDARDAVLAARTGFNSWSKATAYNRGQVLYRIAEVMEGRKDQFISDIQDAEAVSAKKATHQTDQAIDRVLWYAGWADKYAQVLGNTNPVSGPFFNFSIPEPTGVVAAVAPADSSLLGLISVIAPIITSGNSVIVIASTASPIPAITLSECLATSDVIAGNINILTGDPAEIMPSLASHGDVNALDLTGITDPELQKALQIEAAGTVKRVRSAPVNPDWQATPSLSRLRAFTEVKTVWHPLGM